MDIHPIDLGIISFYLLAVIVAGIFIARKSAESVDSYFLGGRNIPWYMLGISNASGMYDITGTMWFVGVIFVYGLKGVWFPWIWPVWNQIFLMVYLAMWMRRSRAVTGAEWLATRFSPGAGLEISHLSTVFFAFVTVIAMIAYAFEGIGKFSVVFFPWDLSANTYAIIILSITTLYVTLGGMYSVVLTDVIQFILMTIVSIWVGLIAMNSVSGDAIMAIVPDGWNQVFFGWNLNLDWTEKIPMVQPEIESEPLYQAIGAFMMLAILKGIHASMAGPTPGYDMQRVLAAKTPREAAMMSGLVTPILMLPRSFFIAGVAVLALANFGDDLIVKPSTVANVAEAAEDTTNTNESETVGEAAAGADAAGEQRVDFEQILPFVLKNFIPVGLVGLVLAGLLAAFMSTFDSNVNAGAAYLVNDVYKRYIQGNGNARSEVWMSYFCSLAVVVIGVAIGLRVTKINSILQWITAGLYGGYVAPNFLKWYWWRLNGIGYFAGMVSGTALAIVQATWPELGILPTQPLYAFPFIFVVSAVCTVAASLATRPESEETLKSFYRSVRPWGFWGPVHEMCVADDASIEPNRGFGRDMFNCLVGTIWQSAIVLLPMYVMLRMSKEAAVALGVVVVTSLVLKFNWYDRLDETDAKVTPAGP